MSHKVATLLVYVLTAEDILVSAAYAFSHDWSRAIYWALAAGICFMTLFLR
jgi:hypothetical protein